MDSNELGEKKTLKYKDVLKEVDNFIEHLNADSIKVQEMLYLLRGDKIDEIMSLLNSCKLPHNCFSSKDLLRDKLKKKFEMKNSDDVFFLEDGIYIKFFMQIESDGKDRRACGIAPEILEEYKRQYFEHDSYKEEVFSIISLVVDDVLSFRKINPLEFRKMFISVFVNMIEIIVIQNMDIDDIKTIRGMSFYLLRELFDDILYYISEDILFNFANKDKKAEEFLSYFSVHETIDKQGVRHKPNPILDETNHAWNMTTIRSTMLQHKRAKQAIYDKRNSLITIKKKLLGYKDEQVKFMKLQKENELELEKLENSHANLHKTLSKVQDSPNEKVKFLDDGVEKIFDKKPLMAKLYKKEDDLISQKHLLKRVVDDFDIKISNKQKDIDLWEKKYEESKEILRTIEKVGHPTDKLYDSIKKALAKTLAKR